MKKLAILTLALTLIIISTKSQNSIDLTFTAVKGTIYQQLDSIKVINRTHPGDTILYWNDTVLSFYWVGIQKNNLPGNKFSLSCSPNPLAAKSKVEVNVPEDGEVYFSIIDLRGRLVKDLKLQLAKGVHKLSLIPGKEKMYLLSASWKSTRKSIKLINSSNDFYNCDLVYTGMKNFNNQEKSTNRLNNFIFEPGDDLMLKGYAEGMESAMTDAPDNSEIYTFQFAYNTPCPGIPIVNYQGRDYNTVQIFNQCWLAKNLNAGVKINKDIPQTNNGHIERYCIYDDLDNCETWGGLYTWDEMMNYSTQNGAQGICPDGWHVASLDDFKMLEGSADSFFNAGDPVWDQYWTYRGTDVGKNLKTRKKWTNDGNGIDIFGFAALPAGQYSGNSGYFGWEGRAANFWTSTEFYVDECGWYIDMSCNSDQDGLSNHFKSWGFSVRCIRD